MGDEERWYDIELAPDVFIHVRKRRDPEKGLDWATVLSIKIDGQRQAVCLYDNAHGYPEMHRFRRGVKLAGEPVSPKASARFDMPAAIEEITVNWEGMVERWQR